jgi:hypothetical protein
MSEQNSPSVSKAAALVVICKHPPGILMRVFEKEEIDVNVLGGGTRKEPRSFAVGESVRINGPAVPFGQAPRCRIVNGYAITTNVPAEAARKWMDQNKTSAMVRNGLIDVFPDVQTAEAEAKKRGRILSGLEQLDVGSIQKNGRTVPRDPRWPAKVNPNLSEVRTDDRVEAA